VVDVSRQSPEPDVTLKIPRPLYERLKRVIADSGFHSVTEFAVYVLRDLASHHEGGRPEITPPRRDLEAGSQVEALSPAEIEAIRKRLESLGYL
jgi:hypothetical protein